MRPRCPHCDSPDTISYWDMKNPPEKVIVEGSIVQVFKSIYPNARMCVDCREVTLR